MTYLPTSSQSAAGNTSNTANQSGLVTATISTTNADQGASVQPSAPTTNGKSATETYVSQMVSAAENGVAFNNETAVVSGSNKFDSQTTPSAPTGSYTQEGTAYVSRATLISQGSISNPVNLG